MVFLSSQLIRYDGVCSKYEDFSVQMIYCGFNVIEAGKFLHGNKFETTMLGYV